MFDPPWALHRTHMFLLLTHFASWFKLFAVLHPCAMASAALLCNMVPSYGIVPSCASANQLLSVAANMLPCLQPGVHPLCAAHRWTLCLCQLRLPRGVRRVGLVMCWVLCLRPWLTGDTGSWWWCRGEAGNSRSSSSSDTNNSRRTRAPVAVEFAEMLWRLVLCCKWQQGQLIVPTLTSDVGGCIHLTIHQPLA